MLAERAARWVMWIDEYKFRKMNEIRVGSMTINSTSEGGIQGATKLFAGL